MEDVWVRRHKGRKRVERFFARLKDEFCGRSVFVPGNRKGTAPLKYGALVVFADQPLGCFADRPLFRIEKERIPPS